MTPGFHLRHTSGFVPEPPLRPVDRGPGRRTVPLSVETAAAGSHAPRTGRVPAISLIILTRNEAANLPDCLDALLADMGPRADAGIVVVDAASTDATVAVARKYAARDPRIRVITNTEVVRVGTARNQGIAVVDEGSAIAFMSADAWPEPGWFNAAEESLADADIVYGPQRHAPPTITVAATVRGLRYHHFRDPRLAPDQFASHVNAVISRRALEAWQFGDGAAEGSLDDILLAKHARGRGLRIAFAPRMRVNHKDVVDLKGEWRKVRREGRGWGALRRRLGFRQDLVLWGAAMATAVALVALVPHGATWSFATAVLVAPGLRRALKSGMPAIRAYGLHRVVAATALAPLFDVTFLASYIEGWVNPE